MSELPKGWTTSNLPKLISLDGVISDGDWIESKDQDPNGNIRLIQLADIGDGKFLDKSSRYMNEDKASILRCTSLEEGDVLIARMPDPLGRACIFPKIDSKAVTVVDICLVRVGSRAGVSNHLLKYWFNSPIIRNQIAMLATGTTRKRITRKKLTELELPVPPYNEQIRIANKLDSILAKVDKAQARLDKIPAILKRFRQSVLAAATSGELTKEWRTLNVVPETELEQIESYWQNELLRQDRKYKPYSYPQGDIDKRGWLPSKLGAICDVHVGSTPKRTEKTYWGGDVKWVSSSEVAFCEIFDTKEKITTLGLDNSSTRLHPPGTVMLAMIGQGKTRGQPAILRAEACHNQNTAALRVPEPFLLSEYLYYFLWEKYEETRKIGGGNNQKALNKATVQSIDISLPSISEQRAIVKKIERLFKKANKVEKQYLDAKTRLDRLTQSILAKAFRGELVPQDPNDEPAEKLLERIIAEKEQNKPKKTTRKRTTKAKATEKE